MAKINPSKLTNRDILVTGKNPSTGEYLSAAQRKALFKKKNVSSQSVFGKPGAIVKTKPSSIVPSVAKTKPSSVAPSTGLPGYTFSHLEKRVSVLENQFSQLSKFLVDDANRERKDQKKLQAAQDRAQERGSRQEEEKQLESTGQKMSNFLLSPIKAVGGAAKGILERLMGFFGTLFAGWLTDKGIEAIKAHATGNFEKLEELKNTVLKNLGIVAAVFVGLNGGLLALPALIGGVVKAVATVGGLIVKLLLSPAGLVTLAGLGLSYGGQAVRELGDHIRGDGKSWWKNWIGSSVDMLSGTAETVGSPFRALFEFVKSGGDINKSNQVMASVDANLRESFRKALNNFDFLNIIPDEKGGFGVLGAYGDAGSKALSAVKSGSRQNVQPTTSATPSAPSTSSTSSSGSSGSTLAPNLVGSGGNGNLADAAQDLKGMSSSSGPDGGKNGCVWAVNQVYRKAGLTPPWGSSLYVPDAESKMQAAGYMQIGYGQRSPGDIMVMYDRKSPPQAHIGVVLANGNVLSNSSGKASFSWEASPEGYNDYYGNVGKIYRMPGGSAVPITGSTQSSDVAMQRRTSTPNVGALGEPSPNIVYKKVAAQGGGGQKQPLKSGSATDVPRISSSNPDNFYTLYSQIAYNVVM